MRKYLIWTFILIIFLLVSGIAVVKIITKIIPLNPEDTGGQYCFIKVTIKQVGDEVIKEEILECVMVEKSLMVLLIGSYSQIFIMQI